MKRHRKRNYRGPKQKVHELGAFEIGFVRRAVASSNATIAATASSTGLSGLVMAPRV